MTAAVTTATGAAECITTQIGQWSASTEEGCTWPTCTTMSKVSSNRQPSSIRPIVPDVGELRRFAIRCCISTLFELDHYFNNTQIRRARFTFSRIEVIGFAGDGK